MKKALIILTILSSSIILATQPVAAQITVDPDLSGGLKPITIPTFFSLEEIEHFSVFSYIALGFSLFFIGLTIYWVFLIIRNAVKILQSEGDDGKIKDGTKAIQSIFIGIGIMFGFFVVLFVVGSFFGMGSIFEWPKKLSICSTGKLYITLALENPDASQEALEAVCFLN